jgi:uncharacterized protein (TIRG00374 family)
LKPMPKALRAALQYLVMIGLTAALLWLSLRGLKLQEGENSSDLIWNTWQLADKKYLMLMALVALISHVLRAERWRMLLVPSGNRVRLGNSFFSLMIGYLVNLAVPRGGEVSRCYNLYKLEGTPVEVSFGTVVVERIVDVLCLLAVVLLAFLMEWKKLIAFLESLGIGANGPEFRIKWWMIAAAIGLIAVALTGYLLRKNEKILKLIKGFREGLLSVFRLERKLLFIVYSVMIWFLYFLMSYCVIRAFETTSTLGFSAVLSVFALGAIAMAAPLPGGTGSYHVIVPAGIVFLYALPFSDAYAFVFIFHAWQTLTMIVFGVISLIVSYLLIRWKKQPAK